MGPATQGLVAELLATRPHPEQAFRACLGVLQNLAGRFGPERLEAACARALGAGARSYHSVKSILEKGLDRVPLPGNGAPAPTAGYHENVRGPDYYQ
jgi:hypothetical protein